MTEVLTIVNTLYECEMYSSQQVLSDITRLTGYVSSSLCSVAASSLAWLQIFRGLVASQFVTLLGEPTLA